MDTTTKGTPTPASAHDSLIALHCSASSGRQWAPFAAALAPGMTLHAPDLLGYAERTPWAARRPITLDDEVDALAPVLEAAGERFHLVGHSYGGAVALQIALRWPERVKTLTVYEPVRFGLLIEGLGMAPAAYEVIRLARSVQLLSVGAPLQAAARFVDYWSGDGAWDRLDAARQAGLALRMTKVGAEFGALLADTARQSDYGRLKMPVRLLGGERSPMPVRQVLARLAGLMPHAACVVFSNLGHMGPVQASERVALALPAEVREGSGATRDETRREREPAVPAPRAAAAAVGRVLGTLVPAGRMKPMRAA